MIANSTVSILGSQEVSFTHAWHGIYLSRWNVSFKRSVCSGFANIGRAIDVWQVAWTLSSCVQRGLYMGIQRITEGPLIEYKGAFKTLALQRTFFIHRRLFRIWVREAFTFQLEPGIDPEIQQKHIRLNYALWLIIFWTVELCFVCYVGVCLNVPLPQLLTDRPQTSGLYSSQQPALPISLNFWTNVN